MSAVRGRRAGVSEPAAEAPPRIALTGGIASGKTAVARAFAQRGVPVIDTDQIARDLTRPGQPALQTLVAAFGPSVLDPQGALDRKRLRARVFADAGARQRLEALLHPLIAQETRRRSAAAGGPYQIVVVPLLFEAGLEQDYDRVLVVDCCEATQLARLQARDGESPASAQRILAAQVERGVRLAGADDVIVNEGSLADLEPGVAALHARYLQWAEAEK